MKYPKDRFDEIPPSLDRRGAHRAPRSRGDKIAAWLWGLGAVVVLVVLGLVAMFIIDNVVSFDQAASESTPTPTATATEEPPVEQVTPAMDAEIPVTVLNGTDLAGVAGGTGDELAAIGWNVVLRDDADSEDYQSSTIYYGAAEDEPAALQLAADLGGGTPTLDPAMTEPGTITIIVGYDLAA